jgi:hypothetical protein
VAEVRREKAMKRIIRRLSSEARQRSEGSPVTTDPVAERARAKRPESVV